jgi:hypothetical protein
MLFRRGSQVSTTSLGGVRASTTLYRTSSFDALCPCLGRGSRSRLVWRTPRPDVVDCDPVHGTGGRAFAILRVLGCQRGEHRDGHLVVFAMDFRPAANAYPPEPRPVLVIVVDEDGRRPCGFDVIEPAQLPRALGFVIDSAGDPAIDDGEADRYQADHPVAADRAQPGDSCSLQCAGDPGLVHGSIIAAPIGAPVRPRAESVVTSKVSRRYEVVSERSRCPRPAKPDQRRDAVLVPSSAALMALFGCDIRERRDKPASRKEWKSPTPKE